ncbi:hypothetical protein BE221DRAFT_200741 [Ostreococcus tauri]|uniref:Uncharacterized protein n=1 Tax=Ostreococcus tauri TaxID=70448 RepID=A0A1Y5ICS1_OSTTA|nr:hypothetical protein BE221DRAFT_200741 [Ostreococcus tauri]
MTKALNSNEFTVVKKELGKTVVHITAKIGTVLDSKTDTVADVHTNSSKRGVSVSTDVYDRTGMWLQMDDGSEMELKPMAGSVNARAGHKIAVLGIQNGDGFGWSDVGRVNLTTGCSSNHEPTSLLGQMKTLTGAGLWFGTGILAGIVAAIGSVFFHSGEGAVFAFFIYGAVTAAIVGYVLSSAALTHTSAIRGMLKGAIADVQQLGPDCTTESAAGKFAVTG